MNCNVDKMFVFHLGMCNSRHRNGISNYSLPWNWAGTFQC